MLSGGFNAALGQVGGDGPVVNQPTQEGATAVEESGSEYASLKAQVEAINNMSYSGDLLACEDCESIYNDEKISLWSKISRVGNLHLNKGLRFNKLGEWFGSESEWQGKEGWENKGYPTMVNTWGVLGTVVSLGAYGTFANTWAWGAGEFAWNTASLGINITGTVTSLTGYNRSPFQYTGQIGFGSDVIGVFQRDPLAIMNTMVNYKNYSLEIRNSFMRQIGLPNR